MTEMDKAYMLISCEIGEEQSLYSQLKNIPEVKDCMITYGIQIAILGIIIVVIGIGINKIKRN